MVLHIYIFVDLVKHGLRNVVGERLWRYRNDRYCYYCTRKDTPTVTQRRTAESVLFFFDQRQARTQFSVWTRL